MWRRPALEWRWALALAWQPPVRLTLVSGLWPVGFRLLPTRAPESQGGAVGAQVTRPVNMGAAGLALPPGGQAPGTGTDKGETESIVPTPAPDQQARLLAAVHTSLMPRVPSPAAADTASLLCSLPCSTKGVSAWAVGRSCVWGRLPTRSRRARANPQWPPRAPATVQARVPRSKCWQQM